MVLTLATRPRGIQSGVTLQNALIPQHEGHHRGPAAEGVDSDQTVGGRAITRLDPPGPASDRAPEGKGNARPGRHHVRLRLAGRKEPAPHVRTESRCGFGPCGFSVWSRPRARDSRVQKPSPASPAIRRPAPQARHAERARKSGTPVAISRFLRQPIPSRLQGPTRQLPGSDIRRDGRFRRAASTR